MWSLHTSSNKSTRFRFCTLKLNMCGLGALYSKNRIMKQFLRYETTTLYKQNSKVHKNNS